MDLLMRHSNNLVVGRIQNYLQTAIKGESRDVYTCGLYMFNLNPYSPYLHVKTSYRADE